ncbi:MAG: hypothetical protein K6A15_06510 [Treponema sp.]|nr:hypothetical protein [Treponema sp.]
MKIIYKLVLFLLIACTISCKRQEKTINNDINKVQSETIIEDNKVLKLTEYSNQLINQKIGIEEFCHSFIGKSIEGNYNSEGIKKNGITIGYLEYFSIEDIGEFFWFEKIITTDTNQYLECTQIEYIPCFELNSICLCKRLNKYSNDSNTVFSLYFFNKENYLQAEKEYTPQYILQISNDTGMFEIKENQTIMFFNDL